MTGVEQSTPLQSIGPVTLPDDEKYHLHEILSDLLAGPAGDWRRPSFRFKWANAAGAVHISCEPLPDAEMVTLTFDDEKGTHVFGYIMPNAAAVFALGEFDVSRAIALLTRVSSLSDRLIERKATARTVKADVNLGRHLREHTEALSSLSDMIETHAADKRPWLLPAPKPEDLGVYLHYPTTVSSPASNPEVEHGQHPQAQIV